MIGLQETQPIISFRPSCCSPPPGLDETTDYSSPRIREDTPATREARPAVLSWITAQQPGSSTPAAHHHDQASSRASFSATMPPSNVRRGLAAAVATGPPRRLRWSSSRRMRLAGTGEWWLPCRLDPTSCTDSTTSKARGPSWPLEGPTNSARSRTATDAETRRRQRVSSQPVDQSTFLRARGRPIPGLAEQPSHSPRTPALFTRVCEFAGRRADDQSLRGGSSRKLTRQVSITSNPAR